MFELLTFAKLGVRSHYPGIRALRMTSYQLSRLDATWGHIVSTPLVKVCVTGLTPRDRSPSSRWTASSSCELK